MKKHTALCAAALVAGLGLPQAHAATTNYAVDEDVMTSPFYFGNNRVRGYDADDRNEHYITADNGVGFGNPATIYMDFSSLDLSSYGPGEITNATLKLQSVVYPGFTPASSENPFAISAQGVNANPFTSITDDTNTGGLVSWSDFYANNVLAPGANATTTVACTDCSIFIDVTDLVTAWQTGTIVEQMIAITGSTNDPNSGVFAGFLNNSENPGSSYLSVSAVPVPAAVWLFGSALVGLVGVSRRRK